MNKTKNYFELRTPRDMLEKAKREHKRLMGNFNIDNVFNYFITAYHIRDYLLKTKSVKQTTVEEFLKDQDLKDCHDLCDKGKHLELTKEGRTDPMTQIMRGTINGAPLNTMSINAGKKWIMHLDNRVVDVKLLANRVLAKWNDFFLKHNL